MCQSTLRTDCADRIHFGCVSDQSEADEGELVALNEPRQTKDVNNSQSKEARNVFSHKVSSLSVSMEAGRVVS